MSRYWTDVLEHGTKKGGQHKNHKYIARVKEGNKYRYFYTQEEIEAYKKAMNNMAKKTMRGDFGNGAERVKKLKEATKYDDGKGTNSGMEKAVQARVNEKMLGKKKAAKLNKKLGLGSTHIEMISGTEKTKSKSKSSKSAGGSSTAKTASKKKSSGKASKGDKNVSGNEATQRRRYAKGDRNADTREGFAGVKSRKGAKGDSNVSHHEAQVGVRSKTPHRAGTAKGDKNVSRHEGQVGIKSKRKKPSWSQPWNTHTPKKNLTPRERAAREQLERNQADVRRHTKPIRKAASNAKREYKRATTARSRGDQNVRQSTDANSTAAARARLKNRRNRLKRSIKKQWGL